MGKDIDKAKAYPVPELPIKGRIVELDGMRGLAILLVIIWHYFGQTVEPAPGSFAAYAMAPIGLSRTGVDLFFVISGFLIATILLEVKSSDNYYTTFYARRFYRILPLYSVWLAIYIVGRYTERSSDIDWLKGVFNGNIPLWSYAIFLQNFEIANRQVWGDSWASSTWSLAVLEQSYLLLPFVIRKLSSGAMLRAVIVAIACAPLFRLLLYFNGNTYFAPYVLLPCRADALGVGVLMALTLRKPEAWSVLTVHRMRLYAALAVLGLGVALLIYRHPHIVMASIGYTWQAVFYGVLLLLVVVEPTRVEKRLFGGKALVLLGTISYGIYLFHDGANHLWHGLLFGRRLSIENGPGLLATLTCLSIVIVLSQLSWRFFEEPLVRLGRAKFRY